MFEPALELLRSLTTPEGLRHLLTTAFSGWWSYVLLFAIVFAETGLLVGFFLPGDSLLFTIGVVAGLGAIDLPTILVVLCVAAIVGDAVGYQLGRQIGARAYERPDSRLFRREHLERTRQFYEKHGGKTIVYARFVPIVRTFAPFVAGVAQMSYRRFLSYNLFGGVGWVLSMTLAGYWLGRIPIIQRHFEKVVLLIVLVSVLPVLLEYWKSRRTRPITTVQ